MSTRLDHVVIAVAGHDSAVRRRTAAGLPPERGGRHPVGTENALVRGPDAAYVELIAAGPGEDLALRRVRSSPGPLSWAIHVDDLDVTRAALLAALFEPSPVREGSRTTPEAVVVAWRMLDVDGDLPFVLQWTAPMPPGPPDGPVLTGLSVTCTDPDLHAELDGWDGTGSVESVDRWLAGRELPPDASVGAPWR